MKLASISVQYYTVCVTSDISTPDCKHVNNFVPSVANKLEV